MLTLVRLGLEESRQKSQVLIQLSADLVIHLRRFTKHGKFCLQQLFEMKRSLRFEIVIGSDKGEIEGAKVRFVK